MTLPIIYSAEGTFMKASGWKATPNNRTGAGYGIRISKRDRDQYFKKTWNSVTLEFDTGEIITVSVSDSFWRQCIELRSASIGKWLLKNNLAPWPKGNPPQLILEPRGEQQFRLSRP